MDKQSNGRNDRTTPRHGKRRERSRTYEQPALDDIPLSPKRSGYVLQLILQQHIGSTAANPRA